MERLLEYLYRYLDFCAGAFKYDMEVFSQGWLYAWILIPAFGYLVFFLLKWAVITLPLWLPFRMIFSVFSRQKSESIREKYDEEKLIQSHKK